MINVDLLRQLGWSEELINAVKDVAEPMRNIPGLEEGPAAASANVGSSTAVYADSVIINTGKAVTVPPSEEDASH